MAAEAFIPAYVEMIENNAFNGCGSLQEIIIPANVKTIEASAFHGCGNLKHVTFNEGLKSIGSYAFGWDYALEELKLPSTLTYIGNDAFNSCNKIQSIEIPDAVTTIGSSAFSNCSSAKTLKLPSSLTKIESWTFYNCGFTTLSIPATIKEIGEYAFSSCNSLLTANITTEIIGNRAFQDCRALTSVSIANGVKEIREGAFFNCESLASITIPEGITEIKSSTFDDCYALTTVSLPSTLTTIESYAFNTCRSMTSITLPEHLSKIGSNAFTECDSLKSIYSLAATPPTMTDDVNAFSGIVNNIILYVKSNAVDTYKAAIYWGEFTIRAFEKMPCAQPTFALFDYMLTIQTQTAGAAIYYTTDGTDPTTESSQYTAPIPFFKKGIVKAIAVLEGYNNSIVSTFDKNDLQVPIPTGTISEDHIVTLTCEMPNLEGFPETKLYYYLNRNRWESSNNWILYKAPIQLTEAAWVHVKAMRDGWDDSEVAHLDFYNEYLRGEDKEFTINNVKYKYEREAFANVVIVSGHELSGDNGTIDLVIPAQVSHNDTTYTVTGIGSYAFSGLQATRSLKLPATIKFIRRQAFWNNNSLTDIEFNEGLETIDENAFSYSHTINNIYLPTTLLSIGNEAFINCGSSSSTDQIISIPAGIQYIGDRAFQNCDKAKAIYCYATNLPKLGENPFGNTTEHATLYVHSGSLTKYQNADYWKEFSTIIGMGEAACLPPTFSYNDYKLTMKSLTPNVTIYYTTDGTVPTTESLQYTEPIYFIKNGTVRAFAVASGYENSLISEYQKNDFYVPTPEIKVSEDHVVTITCETPNIEGFPETTIYYQLNTNSWQDWEWRTYKGPIQLTEASWIHARAERDGWNDSNTSHLDHYSDYYKGERTFTIDNITYYHSGRALTNTGATVSVSGNTYRGNENKFGEGTIDIDIPATVTYNDTTYTVTAIGNYAFSGVRATKRVKLPSTIKSIGDEAFYDNYYLEEIEFNEGLETIGRHAFGDNWRMHDIYLPSTLVSIGEIAFNSCGQNVTGDQVIAIPAGIQYIGSGAFQNCSNAKTVYCYATTLPELGGNPFEGTSNHAILHVPASSLTEYQNTDHWKEFSDITGMDSGTCMPPTFALFNYRLTIKSQTPGATIYYTTDGTEPTTSSPLYTQPIPFIKNGTVRAIAVATGYANSAVTTFRRSDMRVPTPTATISEELKKIVINYDHPNVEGFPETKVYYIFRPKKDQWSWQDGDYDYDEWQLYEKPIDAVYAGWLRIRAQRDGWEETETTIDFYRDYYISEAEINIQYNDPNNKKEATITIAQSENPNVKADAIYYTLDGSDPTEESNRYEKAFTLKRNLIIKAIAVKKGRLLYSAITRNNTVDIKNEFMKDGINYQLTDNTMANELDVVGVSDDLSGDFSIPEDVLDEGVNYKVVNIRDNVFGSKGMTTITLPQTIRNIGNSAFNYCQQLTKVISTAKIESIGSQAFSNCSKLEEYPFNEGLTSIGNGAFQSTALKTAILPNTLKEIGNSVFYNCSKLTSLTLSDSLKSIPSSAFYGCSALTTLSLPEAITQIDNKAFYGCQNLTSISIPDGVESISSEAFNNCYALASVLLPDSLMYIDSRAFNGCRSLTTIALLANIKSVGQAAFEGCTALKTVISEAINPPQMPNGNAFSSTTRQQATLFVKKDAVDVYARDTEWGKFTNIAEFDKLPCEPPTFTYADYVLTISSATQGATIHYTTDGTDPTTSSPICNGSIYLMQNDTIRAIAAAEGYDNSSVAVYRKTDFRVPTPTATLSDDLVMTLSCEMPDLPNFPQTRFFYNQNMSVSTAGTEWIPYNGPVQLTEPGYVHVRAERDNWLTSVVRHANFYTAYYLAPPTIVGDTLSAKTVTITHSQSDAVIYYTLDGTEPSPSSTLYTEAITLTQNTTVKAMATLAKHFNSKSSTKSYKSFTLPAPEIAFEGRYCTITCSEPNVAIYYTIDQTTPTRESNRYSTPFILPQETTHVITFAVKENWNDSPTRESIFYADDSRRCAKPVVLRDGSTNNVRMSTTTTGGVIHYTTDGNDPTANSPIYAEPIEMKENLTVKAITTSDNYFDSEITEFKVNWFQVNKPVIHVEGLYVSITCAKEGAKIYYTLDGTMPTIESELYTERLTMTKACTIKAMATYENFNNSDIAEVQFDPRENKCGTPEFTIDGNMVTITATPIGEGTIIYYTINGTEPTEASIVYTKPIEVTENCMIKALATNPILFNSDIDSLKVNWFKVEKPVIALNGTTVTISCSTPGATVYYAYDETPTAESEVYTQPITIVDNRTIQAIGLKPNFNPSEVATYTPTLFVCDDVAFNYNGRYLQMTTNEGATIYYTTDGTRPTAQSQQYTAPVDIDALCSVNAIAMRKDYRNSSMTTYKVTYVYTGEEAKFEEAGHLEEVFNWAGGANNVESLPIQGKLNDKDLTFIRNISSLRHLDLTDATIEGNTLPDKAFANLPLLSVQLPTQLTSVGDHLFEGCNDLAAIVWNANLNIPQTVIDDIKNPNMLLYANASLYVPNSYTGNLILGTNATSITLTDTESGGNFYCPKRFYAEQISYTHQYSQPTASGETRTQGWETLSLPFDVQNITHEKNGALAPFAKGEDVTKFKPFWLYKLEDTGFMRAAEIQAYTPYIISMPNNASYADDYNLVGRVTFSSTGVYVEEDMANITAKGSVRFTPALQNREKASNVMAINKTDYTDEDGTFSVNGSAFISNLRDVRPFEAYARVGGGLSRLLIGEFLWSDDTAIRGMEMKQLEAIGLKRGIYDLSGRHLSNDSSILQKKRGQHQRVLIINGKKTLQK